ncbi:hypothetical protein [Streptomyces sp. NPDC046751]|uniref:hypothetical protein n=1 Tax=Streptomyces sp. NPDC046751 TaxID=3160977 RepID=UPI0033E6D057
MAGGEKGMRGSGRLQALLLDGKSVGQTVVVPTGAGCVEEAAGSLEDVCRPPVAANGDDQLGALL